MIDLKPENAGDKKTPNELCLTCAFFKNRLFDVDKQTGEAKYWKTCDKLLDPNVIMHIGRNCSLRREIPKSDIPETSSVDVG